MTQESQIHTNKKIKKRYLLLILAGTGLVALLYTLGFMGAFSLARRFLSNQEQLSITELARYKSILSGQEDVGLYYKYAQTIKQGFIPYRDFAIEYPPAAIPVLLIPALFTNDPIIYQALFSLEMGLFAVASAFLAWRYTKQNRPELLEGVSKYFVLATLLCGTLLVARYDAASAFLLLLTVYFVLNDKPALAGFAAGLGFSTKLFPILALAPYGIYLLTQKRWQDVARLIVAFGAITALMFIPAILASPRGLLDSFLYHSDRGLQVESILATPIWIVHSLGERANIIYSYGSVNIASGIADKVAKYSFYAFIAVAAILVITWFIRMVKTKDKNSPQLKKAMFLSILAITFSFVIVNKVFSPQYLIWIAFLSVFGMVHLPKRWIQVLFVTQILTILIFPIKYGELINTDHIAVTLLTIRNLIIAGMWMWLLAKQRNSDINI